ncbi:MAG: 3-hydroxyacyl-ACP dehydratase FabZ family protein [Planctomycetota bacterium]
MGQCYARRANTDRAGYSARPVHFELIDHIIEQEPDRIVAIKNVTAAEEYLQDHFPTFPVLPGVLMIEALVQAGRRLAEARGLGTRCVLGGVKALKYGAFVSPGETLRVEVSLLGVSDDGVCSMKGVARRMIPGQTPDETIPASVSGRFTLRPVRLLTA